MNEIKIFHDERFAQSSTEQHLQMFGVLCYLLAEAADTEDKECAWEILNEASMIGHALNAPAFNTLYSAVAMEITRNFKKKEAGHISIFERIKEFVTWTN